MLKIGDKGSYIELSRKENPDSLFLVYVPDIRALLVKAEETKGEPLSDSEKIVIRNNVEVVAVSENDAKSKYNISDKEMALQLMTNRLKRERRNVS